MTAEMARAFVESNGFFHHGMAAMQHAQWLTLLCLLPLAFVIWQGIRARREGKRTPSTILVVLVTCLGLAGSGCRVKTPPTQSIEVRSLTNGIRVLALPFEGSTNVSIFTYVPMGLVSDQPGHAQWSHLVEHLVIRSTIASGSKEANAETLPDHMRLDWYGHQGNWHEGLEHHRKWLEGVPFTEASLEREKPLVISECDFTASKFLTHKFAIAAWAQAVRHGQSHVALKADVTNATLAEVQAFRDQHFAVMTQAVVCVAGGIKPTEVFAEAQAMLQPLTSTAEPAPLVQLKSGEIQVTWDLDARHLVLTQSVADDPDAIATLSVYARLLTMALMQDAAFRDSVGMALAGADLVSPEGRFFYVSVSLKPEADFEVLRQAVLREINGDLGAGALIARQLASQFQATLEGGEALNEIRKQGPPGTDPSMVEMNLALQVGMNEFRYGPRKTEIADQLSRVRPKTLNTTARKLLRQDAWTIVEITPRL